MTCQTTENIGHQSIDFGFMNNAHFDLCQNQLIIKLMLEKFS